MEIKLKTESSRTHVFLQDHKVAMSIDGLLVRSTTPSYDVSFEMRYDNEWEQFLNEKSHDYFIRYRVLEDVYANKKINIDIQPSSIIWLGHWFQNWKANQN